MPLNNLYEIAGFRLVLLLDRYPYPVIIFSCFSYFICLHKIHFEGEMSAVFFSNTMESLIAHKTAD